MAVTILSVVATQTRARAAANIKHDRVPCVRRKRAAAREISSSPADNASNPRSTTPASFDLQLSTDDRAPMLHNAEAHSDASRQLCRNPHTIVTD
jgi:hypothetical protein